MYACPDKVRVLALKNSIEATRIPFPFPFPFPFPTTLSLLLLLTVTTLFFFSLKRKVCFCCCCFGERQKEMYVASSMRKSFKDSLKLLEADIQHANTLLVLHPCFHVHLISFSYFPI